MAKNAEPPLFDVHGWVYTSTRRQFRVVHATRRRVVIQLDDGRLTLDRRRLESTGEDVVDGVRYSTSKYRLLSEAQELSA